MNGLGMMLLGIGIGWSIKLPMIMNHYSASIFLSLATRRP